MPSGMPWPGGNPTGGINLRIRVKYFASCRDTTGLAREKVQLPSGSTVEGLIETVKSLHEPLRNVERMLVAVNGEYADLLAVLEEGDVVALFPPVSGG